MDHLDAAGHSRGRTRYVDDEPPPAGMLHGAVFGSPVAHGKLRRLDLTAARRQPGVIAVLSATDIPGENQIGSVLPDEPLLAEESLHYRGQPIALVVADDPHRARRALAAIEVEVEELPAVVDPRQAYATGQLIAEPRKVEMGDVDAAWADCDLVVEGECDIAGQEHLYLETQRARATPEEGGAMRILSSTQSPYIGQRLIAGVLGVPLHQVEVEVRRLGGAFGGKEDQATPWAALAALGALHTGRTVEIVLSRAEDLVMTGKRHAYLSDFKIGVTRDGRILALEIRHFQNAGAACDLSLAVLGRTLFHSTNSYFVPNVRVWGAPCRTNIPPATAFRGFGGPQGMFVVESAVSRAAEALGIAREAIQERNLLRPADHFPYGQQASTVRIRECWRELEEAFDLSAVRRGTAEWNEQHRWVKKGFAVMPVTFGISFTATFLNQASALLHVYTDGSVSLSTGGVEMGQGLSTNMATVAARALGIAAHRVRVESTSTRRIANMSASAASSTTLLNGNATRRAAEQVKARLLTMVARELRLEPEELHRLDVVDERVLLDGAATEWDWSRLVLAAYHGRVALSAHGFYATPEIHYDPQTNHGHPFAYHVCGAALFEVTVDCLRGIYTIDAARLVHDLGRPLNRRVDIGQIEGGLAQGLGWMTVEDLRYDADGRNLSAALATYKVPDVYSTPRQLEIRFLEGDDGVVGPYGSKAVGEPPLMYGLGVVFAIRHALRAFRPGAQLPFVVPMTPEQVLLQTQGDDAADELPPELQLGVAEAPRGTPVPA